jgi:hypothetical protein
MAPLNLVANTDLSDYLLVAAVVSKILCDHPGPARRFSVHIISCRGFIRNVNGWLCSESLKGLEELEVTNAVRRWSRSAAYCRPTR